MRGDTPGAVACPVHEYIDVLARRPNATVAATAADVHAAARALERDFVVGVTEDLPSFMTLMGLELGWALDDTCLPMPCAQMRTGGVSVRSSGACHVRSPPPLLQVAETASADGQPCFAESFSRRYVNRQRGPTTLLLGPLLLQHDCATTPTTTYTPLTNSLTHLAPLTRYQDSYANNTHGVLDHLSTLLARDIEVWEYARDLHARQAAAHPGFVARLEEWKSPAFQRKCAATLDGLMLAGKCISGGIGVGCKRLAAFKKQEAAAAAAAVGARAEA